MYMADLAEELLGGILIVFYDVNLSYFKIVWSNMSSLSAWENQCQLLFPTEFLIVSQGSSFCELNYIEQPMPEINHMIQIINCNADTNARDHTLIIYHSQEVCLMGSLYCRFLYLV